MGGGRVVSYIVPPRLSRFPRDPSGLEYTTRSMVPTGDGDGIWRAWGEPSAPWPLLVEPEGDRWRVKAYGVSPQQARTGARALFSLEHPLEEFYRQVRREPILRGTERTFRGLRLPRDASLYESLVHAVIGQQLSVRVATTLSRRLFDACGSYLSVDGVELPAAPAPTALLSLGRRGLRRTGLSRAKAAALLGIAQGQIDGRFARAAFRRAPVERAIERLDAQPGVGRWTAENALLRGVGRTDLFVAGDLGLRAALAKFGALPRHAPESAAREWADARYPGWGSYATLYLWRKLVTAARPDPLRG